MEKWSKQKKAMDGFVPFSSNVVTYKAKALLPFGTYTVSQNTRDYRPGLKKRPGLERMDTYGYLGDTIDLRPAYDDGSTVTVENICAYSNDGHATLDIARGFFSDNEITPDSNANRRAPGVHADELNDEWAVGRVATTFNLKRLSYATEVTAASLFILMSDDLDLADAQPDEFAIAIVESSNDPFICSTDPIDYTYVRDTGSDALCDRKAISDSAYIEDYIVEIPLNAVGLAALTARLTANGGDGVITLVQMEYDVDFMDDQLGLGGAIDDESHEMEQRIDRYFPFLRITVDAAPAVISLFQYNQMRSGNQETIAYYENGDILSSYNEPPEVRDDVRPTSPEFPGAGDNDGYWPYSDGTPSENKGDEDLRSWTPTYDSKWGRFIWREGGENNNDDWDHCYDDTDLFSDPPSWGVLDDVLIMADGRDYAKFYGGSEGQPCKASLVVLVPGGAETGTFRDDWDGDGIRVDLPAAWTTNSRFYVFTPIKTEEFIIDVLSASSGAGILQVARWTGSAWSYLAGNLVTDTTIAGGVSLKQDGRFFGNTLDTNQPTRLFGLSGYWYEFKTSGDLDATFDIKATYNFQELTNVWDGVLVDAIESKVFDASVGAAGTYYTYANTAITLNLMEATDAFYFSTLDRPDQIYFDVGATPNTGGVATVLSFEYWNGSAWTTWSVIEDNTNGLTNSGFIRLNATEADNAEKQPFQGSLWASYWWRMTVSQTLGDNIRVSLTYEPELGMSDFGTKTECMGIWKERCVYSFDKYPSWIYVTQNGTFNVLNGADYAVLQAGDGRRHSVVAMRKFHNELMVWQEEKGMEGGCLTLFEGYSPTTFGKLLLSAKIGTLNANSVVVIDGALEASRTDYKAATVAYFISNYGIFMSDGQTVQSISSSIQNYFDPDHADCIRNGYQEKCWMVHDPTHQVLRMGIVSGSSATEPNIFPVYDLITRRWSFDAFSSVHIPRCMAETSGEPTSAVQVAVIAGTFDGHIYLASSTNLHDGTDTAIDMQVRIELNDSGKLLELRELGVRMKKQAAGNCLFTVYENGVLTTEHSKTIDMSRGETGEENVVERLITGVYQEDMISIVFANNVVDQDMYLYDFWIDAESLINR
jgi:hypothetical protein